MGRLHRRDGRRALSRQRRRLRYNRKSHRRRWCRVTSRRAPRAAAIETTGARMDSFRTEAWGRSNSTSLNYSLLHNDRTPFKTFIVEKDGLGPQARPGGRTLAPAADCRRRLRSCLMPRRRSIWHRAFDYRSSPGFCGSAPRAFDEPLHLGEMRRSPVARIERVPRSGRRRMARRREDHRWSCSCRHATSPS